MMNWEGNGCGIFKILFQLLPGGTGENHTPLSQDSQHLGQELNPQPCKYKARVLLLISVLFDGYCIMFWFRYT